MKSRRNHLVKLMLVIVLIVPLSAVTVNPALCPTNKIAPHRRSLGSQPRTFGAFYDLLSPGPGTGHQPYNPGLQEDPEENDLDDCGDIDDYDENDLSSLTPQHQQQYQMRQGHADSRLFFGLFDNNNPNPQYPRPPNSPNRPQEPYPPQRPQASYPPATPQRPQAPYPPVNRPQRPYPPNRPPYWSGGHFGNNPYRPPVQHHPSDDVRPVHEGHSEYDTTPIYRPAIVGGPLGHVVGMTTVKVPEQRPQRPTRRPYFDQATVVPPTYSRYPTRPTEPSYTTRRPRPRNLNNNDSILGSFLDLLF